MKFKNEIAIIQQKATQTNVGVIRRQAILNELNIQKGQTIIDIVFFYKICKMEYS